MRVWLYSREDVLSIPFFLLFLLAFSSGDGVTLQLEMPDDNYPGLKVGLILMSPLFFHAHNLWSKFYQTNRATRIYSLRIFFSRTVNSWLCWSIVTCFLFFFFSFFYSWQDSRFYVVVRFHVVSPELDYKRHTINDFVLFLSHQLFIVIRI